MSNITVSSASALTTALKSAHSGDTILLQSGTYSGLALHDMIFAGGVTVSSADSANRAVLTDFSVLRVDGLTFSHLEIKTIGKGFGVNISNSQNIHFDQDFVHGSLDGNVQNDGSGLGFLDSSNISVTNSEFTQLRQAVAVGADVKDSVSEITVSGNNVHGVAKSGLVFAGASSVRVTGNSISDITPTAGDHPDAIQFFTTGTTVAAHDIVISDNIVLRGSGAATQGIFLRDQTGHLAFENVRIDNNMIVGTGYGGIYVMGANGLELSGNKLYSGAGATNNTTFLVQGADNVTATNNHAQAIAFDNVTHLTQAGNSMIGVVTDGGVAAVNEWLNAHAALTGAGALTAAVVTASTAALATTAVALAQMGPAPAPAAAPPAPLAVVAAAAPAAAVTLNATQHDLMLSQSSKAQLDGVGNGLDNVITGNAWNNKLMGMAGNDTLNGGGGADTLAGGAGNDTYYVQGGATIVVEDANRGNDTVIAKQSYQLTANVENLVLDNSVLQNWNGTGNELNNRITGNAGLNVLTGGGGADTIDGGAGNDVLIGGTGDDRLTGGAGADCFRFAPGGGHDVITDFGFGGKDTIDTSAYAKAGITSTMHAVGHDLMINFSNGDSIYLAGVEQAALKSWFAGWIA